MTSILRVQSISSSPVEACAQWYAIQVRRLAEKSVEQQLHAKKLDVYLPMKAGVKTWSDRVKRVETALFPGYLFCKFDSKFCLPVLNTPGIQKIVGFGNGPTPVDPEEIENLQRLGATELERNEVPMAREGSAVLLVGGPLKGVRGLFVRSNKNCRLLLSVTLLQRSVSVEVDERWVLPVPEEAARCA